jgi:hypothetical protein
MRGPVQQKLDRPQEKPPGTGQTEIPDRKPPGMDRHARQPVRRKPPGREDRPDPRQLDMWPYPAEEVEYMRRSLAALGGVLHMPPPDDGIVLRVLDKAHGAPARGVEQVLADLHKRGKFGSMKSWGLVPIVVADAFRCAAVA